MSAKDRLQDAFPALLAALESTAPSIEAMAPFRRDLRLLCDPQVHEERIDAAIDAHVGAITQLSTRAQTGALRRRLELKIEQTSLEAIPCDAVLRDRLTALHEKRNLACQVPHSPQTLIYRSTIESS